MCRSACEFSNARCADFFGILLLLPSFSLNYVFLAFYNQSSLNCSAIDVITGQSQWPEEFHENSFLGTYITTNCTKELPKSGIFLSFHLSYTLLTLA